MLAALKRHPLPIEAFFEFSLVLTFAFPQALLQPLLPPGLVLDTYGDSAFLAIALVQTRALRPVGLPHFLGKDFFLSGYRIFSRYRNRAGRSLRGLRILRSDTDSRWMTTFGNLLTHYSYRLCSVDWRRAGDGLDLAIATRRGEADLRLHADLVSPSLPPAGSPFPDWATARRYAGPLPFTFDYEAATGSVVIIEGVRQNWNPRPVSVTLETAGFFARPPFDTAPPVLANAFFLEGIPYRWKKGLIEPLSAGTLERHRTAETV
jgi:hypothetical protein